jgi:hypothetical protein
MKVAYAQPLTDYMSSDSEHEPPGKFQAGVGPDRTDERGEGRPQPLGLGHRSNRR